MCLCIRWIKNQQFSKDINDITFTEVPFLSKNIRYHVDVHKPISFGWDIFFTTVNFVFKRVLFFILLLAKTENCIFTHNVMNIAEDCTMYIYVIFFNRNSRCQLLENFMSKYLLNETKWNFVALFIFFLYLFYVVIFLFYSKPFMICVLNLKKKCDKESP